ncbi:NTP transferase domain-containing protein [Sphingobacterium sp. lm-10]|nr:NTP transferase domain-containing protein [Sphingobacterium sp. lm-10]
MGDAKDQMDWYGKEQRYFIADILSTLCEVVYISCRQEQLEHFDTKYHALTDTFLEMGPFGGILTALRSDREAAWLVVACDLPLLNRETLQFLIDHRDDSKLATAFENPLDGLPEPLITIWEPKSYPVLLQFLGMGRTSPRKVLLNNDVHILTPLSPKALMNVNTPEDAAKVKLILSSKSDT